MTNEYDVIVIGLGPAGMAVSIMASEMGLKVLAIEPNKIGGECMNVGCIPSKALLKIAQVRRTFFDLNKYELESNSEPPQIKNIFGKIQSSIKYINENKTVKMFEKVKLLLGEGKARFIDKKTVSIGNKKYIGKKIFIATGTKPFTPPIPGIQAVNYLTNDNIFDLQKVPKSLTIIGGGAIGCEMAQAFSRLGSKVSIVHMDQHLMPLGDSYAGNFIENIFKEEGITVLNSRKIEKVYNENNLIYLLTGNEETIASEKLLVAAGRQIDIESLQIENAGVKKGPRGIKVNKYLQTTNKNIYAVGDCNGEYLLSHAAMHQGMIGLINSILPKPFKNDFRSFVVPWTVFTDPQVSFVGKTEKILNKLGKKYKTYESKYSDYGAAIAEEITNGSVKVIVGPFGRIYGASIIGEGSGEMINEWGLAIQKKIRLHDIMMLQHSFPSMSFLNKRVSEIWMMDYMKSNLLKKIIRLIF